jgi:hypothetical protein
MNGMDRSDVWDRMDGRDRSNRWVERMIGIEGIVWIDGMV